MTVAEDVADQTVGQTSDVDPRVLSEEARRRRRRRFEWSGVAVFLFACVAALVVFVTNGSTNQVVPTASAGVGGTGAGAAGARPSVQSVTFGDGFVPDQVVAASGKIWVVGSTRAENGCEIEEVDQDTLRMQAFPLPGCGTYVAMGGGQIFLADGVFTSATDSEVFHIETFDTTTHQSEVKAPVDLITTGTGYAHMALAYGGGTLWLDPWNDHVLEISPSTGAVVATVSDTLSPAGGHPVLASIRGSLWLAPGVGGPALVDQLTAQSSAPVTVFRGSQTGAIVWLSEVGDRVWAEADHDSGEGPVGPPRLVAFSDSGQEVLDVSAGRLGQSALAVSGDHIWAVTAGANCTGRQRVWTIDGQSGTLVLAASFASPVVPCPTDFGGSQLAVSGRRVFVLGGSGSPVLFRVTTTRRS